MFYLIPFLFIIDRYMIYVLKMVHILHIFVGEAHSRSKPLIPEVPSFRMSHTWPHGSHKIWPRSKGCLKKYPYSFYTVQLYTYYDSYDYVIVLHTKALLTFTWHELMLQLTNSGSLEIASLTHWMYHIFKLEGFGTCRVPAALAGTCTFATPGGSFLKKLD